MVKVQGNKLKLSGKRDELLKRVSDCIKSWNHHTLDPSIDDGKWFSAKVLKENAKLQANSCLSSLPFVPSTGWRAFASQKHTFAFQLWARALLRIGIGARY